jgi:hypothetical protein
MLKFEELAAEAQARAGGLEYFGEDSFREPMERLLDAVNRESRFSAVGTVAFREMILKALTNRLQVEDWYHRHPEIDDEEIVAPVFGVGLPRTGSSFLSSLMALDPGTRSLRTWESPTPCPPPIEQEIDGERLAAAQHRIDLFKDRYPNLFAMVPMGVHEPTECYEIMMNAFCCDYYYQFADCSGFLDWFYEPGRDYTFGYHYHKRVLKLLQWRCPPKRWALKMPGHSVMIDGLFAVYPDARFIWTHREPDKVISSVVKLVAVIREDFLEDARTNQFGKYQVSIWERSIRRLQEFRQGHEDAFIDIYHPQLLMHPQDEIQRLYAWLGWRWDPPYVKAIADWCYANPKTEYASKSGSNLDIADIRRRFTFYTKRFYPGPNQ